jgi:hypothetical protein
LLTIVNRLKLTFSPDQENQSEGGFGTRAAGKDLFAALVGMLGVLKIFRGERTAMITNS